MFAVYDVVVNGAIVSGALIAALLVPASGKSFVVPALVSLVYITSAAWFLRPSRFSFSL
ncbi:unannotated protein [freshwater metagenome]|uniref:Unannotated protein n=1 Tax=freshwater metagenome TaxID=449393 RepID=A0A6J6W275_9ZZZZ